MAPGGGVRRAPAAVAAAVLVATVAASCADDNDDGQPPPPAASRPGATGTPSVPTSPDDSTRPAPNGPYDPRAAERQIKENWRKFFDPKLSNAQKAKYLENGDQLGLLLEAFNGDERGRQTSAKVTRVDFTSASEADVTYTLSLNNAPVLPNSKGVSVYQDKVWKVSLKTLCALVGMSGNALKAPGC